MLVSPAIVVPFRYRMPLREESGRKQAIAERIAFTPADYRMWRCRLITKSGPANLFANTSWHLLYTNQSARRWDESIVADVYGIDVHFP